MIAAAQAHAAEAGVSPDFRQLSGEAFIAPEPFDAALCLFTTLGQISETGANSGLVQPVYDALRPAGTFVVETPQRDWAVRHLKTSERFGGGERYADVSRRYDPQDQALTEVFELVSPQATRSYLLRYRLYSRAELVDLLQGVGFMIQAAFGDYEGTPLGPDSAVMLLFARKPASLINVQG